MPQPIMAYQPQLFSYDAERAQSLAASNRRSALRYEPASYPPSSYPPSGTSQRGSWPLSSHQPYPVTPDVEAQGYSRRLSMESQGSWTQDHTASRRLSEPYSMLDSDGLSSSPSFQPSSPWSAASDISPSTPPLYATQDPYGRPTGASSGPISEPLDCHWNTGYQGVTQSDIRTQIPPSCDGPRRYGPASIVHVAPFDSQSFDDMIIQSGGGYTPPPQGLSLDNSNPLYRISPDPSPSPPPFYNHTLPNPPAQRQPAPANSRRPSVDRAGATKQCSHCHATSTPLWRREPTTLKPLCNACGLYLQQRNKLRPQELIDADTDDGDSTDSDQNYVGPECSHCHTHRTSVWRRSKTGEQLCNACGVYLRLRGKPRPLSLKKNKIKPRTKHAPKS
ncbi:hypothetical protein BDQ17DRAFT_1357174 [Cyathus striatus]|nr:hypothetical protein BDQ17DRAFT_1357174 [Cyathus striatus]